MTKKFNYPNFTNGCIELRIDNGDVCIYATDEGLEKIIEFCNTLLDKKSNGHIHISDFNVLTSDSLNGVIAKFVKQE